MPEQPSPPRDRMTVAAFVIIVGGILRLAAYFLPWLTLTGPAGTKTLTGSEFFNVPIPAATAAGIILAGALTIRAKALRSAQWGFWLGVWGLVSSGLNASTLMKAISDIHTRFPTVTTSVGPALPVQIAGGLLATGGGIWAIILVARRRKLSGEPLPKRELRVASVPLDTAMVDPNTDIPVNIQILFEILLAGFVAWLCVYITQQEAFPLAVLIGAGFAAQLAWFIRRVRTKRRASASVIPDRPAGAELPHPDGDPLSSAS